jgi:alpha-D-xyloside xylohydrolase
MNSENKRDIYLPSPSPSSSLSRKGEENTWVDFFTGKRYEGGRWYYGVDCPLELMPVFVHEGASIPFYPIDVENTDEMDQNKVTTLTITPEFKGLKSEVKTL